MNKKGFTLIELLVVIVIIAIIMALVFPSALKLKSSNEGKICDEYKKMMIEYAKVNSRKDGDYIDLVNLEELDEVKRNCDGYVIINHSSQIPSYSAYISCTNGCQDSDYAEFEGGSKGVLLTAENKTMTYGGTAPSYTYTVGSLSGSEQFTVSPLNSDVTFRVQDSQGNIINVNSTTPAGTYSIIPSATTKPNYRLSVQYGTLTINPKKCESPTNISVGTNGIVTWNQSSDCGSSVHQVKVGSGNWQDATSGVDKKNEIVATPGEIIVSVKSLPKNSNYAESEAATKPVMVCQATLTKGTGISSTVSSGNYIDGTSVSLSATPSSGFSFLNWTQTIDSTQVVSTSNPLVTNVCNVNYTANASGGAYTLNYIDNLFAATSQYTNSTTATYDATNNYLTINGTPSATTIMSLWNLERRSFSANDVYQLQITYVSGSYTCTDTSKKPVFVIDLTNNGSNYSDRTTSPASTVSLTLPTSGTATTTLTVASSRTGANGLQYWLWQAVAGNTTFNNYKVRVVITKVHSKNITYQSTYGTLATPTKTGYEFNGWYTDFTGGSQITSSTTNNTIGNQTVYARYTPHKLNIQYNGNGSDVTWCSTNTNYDMDSNKFEIKVSNQSKDIQSISYGQYIDYSAGLNNYNNTNYTCFEKSGKTAKSGAEWILNGTTKTYNHSDETVSAIGLANDANCNLTTTATCTARLDTNWKDANPISVTASQSWNPSYSTSAQSKSFTGATNAQGSVTYAINSQPTGSYFSIPTAGTASIQMKASTPAGTYSVVIRATAAGNGNYISGYKDITMTVTVGKSAATCPTIADWTGKYDGNQHSISVSGGSGGTVQYKWNSTSDSWRNTIPTASSVGSWKVYVQVLGDSNHNTVDCSYKTVTINKADNPISVTASQTVSATFSTSAQSKSFTAATNAQGSVTYAISSQPTGSYFSIPTSSTASIQIKASTPAGTYSVVVKATAAGNDNYSSGSKDITLSVTVGKAASTAPTLSNTTATYDGARHNIGSTGGTSGLTIKYAYCTTSNGTSCSDSWSAWGTTEGYYSSVNAGKWLIKAYAAGNSNYNDSSESNIAVLTINKAANPISVTATQSWTTTYSTSAQSKSFTAATNAQGSVTYAIQSQPSGSYFSIPTSSTASLQMKASTPAGTYSVVIRATAAGNSNYNSGSKDITMTINVKYRIKFNANGGSGSMDDITCSKDADCTLTDNAFTKSGATFMFWSTSSGTEILLYDTHTYSGTGPTSSGYVDFQLYKKIIKPSSGGKYGMRVQAKGKSQLHNYLYGTNDSSKLQMEKTINNNGVTDTNSVGDGRNRILPLSTSSYTNYQVDYYVRTSSNPTEDKHLMFRVSINSEATIKNIKFYKRTGNEKTYINKETVNNISTSSVTLYAIWNSKTWQWESGTSYSSTACPSYCPSQCKSSHNNNTVWTCHSSNSSAPNTPAAENGKYCWCYR